MKVFARSLVAIVFAAALGCGGNKEMKVTGNVTFEGAPVEEGSILFEPDDGKRPTLGGSITAGKYEAVGPAEAAGKMIVRISAMKKTGRMIEAGSPAPKGTKVEEIVKFIPAAYNDKSTLVADLSAGGTIAKDFPLTATGK